MSYRDLDIKLSYISCGAENIATSFLLPVLKQSKRYRRSVGFFSSTVLTPILDGVVTMARNGGTIQLIASPKLSQEDVDAISLGYKQRENVIRDAFSRDFEAEMDALDNDLLRLLADLIADNVLDIKIAVTETSGIYHDKLGILDDFGGNTLVFYGSPNSTFSGYQSNYEKIRVVRSWNQSDAEAIADEVREFDELWNGTNPYVKTYDYSESAKKKVLDIVERRSGKINNHPIVLRDYQSEAIQAWVDNNYHGFYVMATGTGKTWTAIYSAKRLLDDHESMIVITAPYKHLVKQWSEDVEKVFPEATVILISSENPSWQQQLTSAIVKQRIKGDSQIVVISTITSFNLPRFKETIAKSKQCKLLIVDEAHRFTKRPDELKSQYSFMLGLSATPYNGKNFEKGKALLDFFGGQVFDLPIEKALDKGFLVKYYYHPVFVEATEQEEELFRKKSAQLAACFKNGVCIDPEGAALHSRARLRIIAMAEEKIEKIDSILANIVERNHFIVYCGDGKVFDAEQDELRHIEFIQDKLSSLGYKPSQFTASETMSERMDLVKLFNDGNIDSLVAIRCLDEGINIPSINGALILASNDDYREFVQRRGRILRTYPGKDYANIYDVVVLPSHSSTKYAEIELRRYYEYARLALNSEQRLSELNSIASEYGLELSAFVTSFDDDMEVDIDD